ncbi:MAG: nicotinate (nicotinamide) nucleotide adenylyltransferase [Treponemataceae bacterium]|nr:nicotinate (nicotinamide) nucleotide adenylyltransferase [Treponemataceae bacterium]
MKIALFGGSFNPVHNGHVALGKTVVDQLGYDRVVYIPAYQNPFKSEPAGATDADRLAMLHAALDGYHWADVEPCEIERGGVSYTYDTVVSLLERYRRQGLLAPGEKPALLVGSDISARFSEWYRVQELVQLVDLLVARRPCEEADDAGVALQFPFAHTPVVNQLYDASSSAVRALCAQGKDFSSLVPTAVYGYILERGLYGQKH